MKKIITLILCFVSFFGVAQIANPGFENWTSGNPDGWLNSNIANFVAVVNETSDAFQGNSAAELTVAATAFGNVPGTISQISIPVTYTPESISFWMKSVFAGNNQLQITATFTDGTNPSGTAIISITETYTDYIEITIPVESTGLGSTPTQASLGFAIVGPTGSITGTTVGTTVWIDDVSFSTTALSSPELETTNSWGATLFPNPNSGNELFLEWAGAINETIQLELIDISGKLISTNRIYVSQSGMISSIPTHALTRGVYFVRIKNNNEVKTLRFNKI